MGTVEILQPFCKLLVLLACVSPTMQTASIQYNESAADNASLHRVNQMAHVLDTLLVNYDKRVRPDVGGSPVSVTVSLYVLATVPINEISMDFTVTFFFRQYWRDHRLAFERYLQVPSIKPSGHFADQIWLPDAFFETDMSDHNTRHDFMMEIKSDGNITYSSRKRVRSYCLMDMSRFPMDIQNCEMSFGSYGYNDKDILYAWSDGATPVTLSERLTIPQYTLVEWEVLSRNEEYITGNFSVLAVSFKLKRHLGFYLIQDFIPTLLIVMLSWVGFWIDDHSVPARVSLGITTVLSITTLFFGIQATLPKVGYIKAIDYYLLGSFFFVFGALVEFAIICTVNRNREKKTESSSRKADSTQVSSTVHAGSFNFISVGLSGESADQPKDLSKGSPQTSSCFPVRGSAKVADNETSSHRNHKPTRERGIPHPIDRASRILFPVAYFVFLLIYCIAFVAY